MHPKAQKNLYYHWMTLDIPKSFFFFPLPTEQGIKNSELSVKATGNIRWVENATMANWTLLEIVTKSNTLTLVVEKKNL